MDEKHSHFSGTYFNKDSVSRLATTARIFAWIVAVYYLVQWIVQFGTQVLQIGRGFWAGMGITDIAQNILMQFEQPLRGLIYFVLLQGVAQFLLIFMDIEDNTRRGARG